MGMFQILVEGYASTVIGFARSNFLGAWRFACIIREILDLAGALAIKANWVARGS